jgi:hypothetical protein
MMFCRRGNNSEDPVRAIKNNFERLKRKYKRKYEDYTRINSNAQHLIKETRKRKKRFKGLRQDPFFLKKMPIYSQ